MIPSGGPILEESSTQAEALGTIFNDPGTGYNLKAELERAESDEYLYADLTSYPVVSRLFRGTHAALESYGLPSQE